MVNKKEMNNLNSRNLGWLLIVVSITLALAPLINLNGSITGLAVHEQGTITSETVDVYIGDSVVYTNVLLKLSCDNSNCPGNIVGSELTIDTTIVNPGCTCQVMGTDSQTYTVTLNIVQSSKTTQTEDDLSTTNPDTLLASNQPSSDPTADTIG